MSNPLKIAFLGTPEFAGICLEALLECGCDIAVVITAPDRQKGRGQKVQTSDVKDRALKHNLPVLQPNNLKDEGFQAELRSYQVDLGIVVAFRMLPEAVWQMPRLGTMNLHASLLPNYRGAAPINWALINGEKKTGVTTFFLKHQIDTGDILLQEEVDIAETMNAGELHDELARVGSNALCESVKSIESESYELIDQNELISDNCALMKAPKIFKEDCQIDWSLSCSTIYNKVRGLSPYPAAWSILETEKKEKLTFKIFSSEMLNQKSESPGTIRSDGRNYLDIGCNDYYLRINELQLQGKQRMTTDAFLRGFDINKIKLA